MLITGMDPAFMPPAAAIQPDGHHPSPPLVGVRRENGVRKKATRDGNGSSVTVFQLPFGVTFFSLTWKETFRMQRTHFTVSKVRNTCGK